MMVCPNCGRTVTDDSMQFCPACGYSFNQQPAQQYRPDQYGYRPYGAPGYPRKSTAVALVLSFLFAGLGQLYVGKIKRGITFIVIYVILSGVSTLTTLNVNFNDISAVRNLLNNQMFILVVLVSLAFWAFNMFDAYRQARKYNEASVRNDLARFLKDF